MLPPLVSRAQWHSAGSGVVLVDVRRDVPGLTAREAYDRGHLPGAVFVDLERVLAAAPSAEQGRHPLPEPEVFAQGLARAGLSDDDTVVAYDDADGVIAARLVWMLRVTGHDAALLDGGLRPDDELTRAPADRRPGRFTARPWPSARLAGLPDATDPARVVLDARSRERFLGTPDPLDPRPGHIPGARSLPCRDNLDGSGHVLPVPALRERFADVGVTAGADVVSYCGSGVTACHTLLLMEHVGLPAGRLYPGSWSEYASDPGRPVELGTTPG